MTFIKNHKLLKKYKSFRICINRRDCSRPMHEKKVRYYSISQIVMVKNKIKLNQIKLIEDDAYNSKLIISDVNLKFFYDLELIEKFAIWHDNNITIYYNIEQGYVYELCFKDLEEDQKNSVYDYDKKEVLSCLETLNSKFLKYDSRLLKEVEFLQYYKNLLKILVSFQEMYIGQGLYTYKLELSQKKKENSINELADSLKGYNRFVVYDKENYKFFVYCSVIEQINIKGELLSIMSSEKGVKVEEQFEGIVKSKKKQCIIGNDSAIIKYIIDEYKGAKRNGQRGINSIRGGLDNYDINKADKDILVLALYSEINKNIINNKYAMKIFINHEYKTVELVIHYSVDDNDINLSYDDAAVRELLNNKVDVGSLKMISSTYYSTSV